MSRRKSKRANPSTRGGLNADLTLMRKVIERERKKVRVTLAPSPQVAEKHKSYAKYTLIATTVMFLESLSQTFSGELSPLVAGYSIMTLSVMGIFYANSVVFSANHKNLNGELRKLERYRLCMYALTAMSYAWVAAHTDQLSLQVIFLVWYTSVSSILFLIGVVLMGQFPRMFISYKYSAIVASLGYQSALAVSLSVPLTILGLFYNTQSTYNSVLSLLVFMVIVFVVLYKTIASTKHKLDLAQDYCVKIYGAKSMRAKVRSLIAQANAEFIALKKITELNRINSEAVERLVLGYLVKKHKPRRQNRLLTLLLVAFPVFIVTTIAAKAVEEFGYNPVINLIKSISNSLK